MIKLPLFFEARSNSKSGINQNWQTNSSKVSTTVCIPTEFQGPGGGLSPEDLFAQALTNCFVATFKVYAENSKLNFDEISVETILKVDLNENKKPFMSEALLKVLIKNPLSKEKAELLARKTFESGFILNSVKTKLRYELEVNSSN